MKATAEPEALGTSVKAVEGPEQRRSAATAAAGLGVRRRPQEWL